VVGRENGICLGCAALCTLAPGVGEIHHLWVHERARGRGLSRALLSELERRACSLGHRVVRLDTHVVLAEAISLYRSSGYREVAKYNDNVHAGLWFEKQVGAPDQEGNPCRGQS
jgi:ribosomal protein S18 acetylase RimI-like enzyme